MRRGAPAVWQSADKSRFTRSNNKCSRFRTRWRLPRDCISTTAPHARYPVVALHRDQELGGKEPLSSLEG